MNDFREEIDALIGLDYQVAKKICLDEGLIVRLVTINGKPQMDKIDEVPNRVNLSIVDNVVTQVHGVG